MRELKLSYLEIVQKETNAFLNTHIKHDFLRPDRELSLDLTVKEAELLISANEEVRALADSGELRAIHNRYNDVRTRIETEYLVVREHLAKTLQIIESKENEIFQKLASEFGFINVKLHGENAPLLDALGLSRGDNAFTNLSIVEAAIEKDIEGSETLKSIRGQLHAYIGVKAKIFEIDAQLKSDYLNHVTKDEEDITFVRDELKALQSARDQYQQSFERFEVADFAKAEYDTFVGTLSELAETSGKQVASGFAEFEQAHSERQKVYNNFNKGNTSESMTVFRSDLLQHLAGNIIVKEHRQRYQKEQFDRFISSLQYNKLYKKNQTLREFCIEYSNMIEILIEDSHNDRSPKIEANYDDFGEKTIRPFNATIFYYFFSADRRKRTIAQWLLSAVRYPNDRIRRAYMRFFA